MTQDEARNILNEYYEYEAFPFPIYDETIYSKLETKKWAVCIN